MKIINVYKPRLSSIMLIYLNYFSASFIKNIMSFRFGGHGFLGRAGQDCFKFANERSLS